jgi:stage II sporulation protein D
VDCSADRATQIRVAIARDVKSLSLSVKGFYRLIDSGSGKILSRGKYLKTALTADKNNVILAGVTYSAAKVLIEADDPESISIDGRKYRGNIELIRKGNARLWVVNYIDLEDYVKGILYHEASHYWPQEALKAQAVVCRAYAVYQMRQAAGKDFDVTSDVYSQVYGGKTSERYRTNQAVDQTHGQVLTYKGKVFPAYFHSTCAGHTEDASLVWNIDVAPLRGVSCDFCKESPHFNWHQEVSFSRIKQALLKAGYKECGTIESVVAMNRDASGRIKELLIKTDTKDIRIAGKDFRIILGPDSIRSVNFKISSVGQAADFTGIGWGHGVGMCQWGAYFMAKEGHTYTQILEYYYPGSEIS